MTSERILHLSLAYRVGIYLHNPDPIKFIGDNFCSGGEERWKSCRQWSRLLRQ